MKIRARLPGSAGTVEVSEADWMPYLQAGYIHLGVVDEPKPEPEPKKKPHGKSR